MTKSDLIEKISFSQGQLSYRDVELCVKAIIEKMAESSHLEIGWKYVALAVFASIIALRE